MKTTKTLLAAASLCLGLFAATNATAAPVTFDLIYLGNNQNAAGYITFDDTYLPKTTITEAQDLDAVINLSQPSQLVHTLPSPMVLGISLKVTGTGAGTGTFGLSDFTSFSWKTEGKTLDFSQNLVGQLGDFGLFGIDNAPLSQWYFDLTTNGGTGDQMTLTSMTMRPSSTPVPAPAAAWLLGSGLLGLIGVARRKAA